uniref:Uncharacterized protein n=1 Tax=Oryza glumipatula TaxID=40148 RepID=A0A0D9YQ61_9ORYZ
MLNDGLDGRRKNWIVMIEDINAEEQDINAEEQKCHPCPSKRRSATQSMGDGVDAVGGGVGSTVGASYDAGCLEMRLAIVEEDHKENSRTGTSPHR